MINLKRLRRMDSKDMAAFLARYISDEQLCFFCGRNDKEGCSVGSCRSRSVEDIIKGWLDRECAAEAKAATGVKGRWLINCDGYYPYCSECGYEPRVRVDYNIKDGLPGRCPRCGADMPQGWEVCT